MNTPDESTIRPSDHDGKNKSYGWLSPKGNFYPVGDAQHSDWAIEQFHALYNEMYEHSWCHVAGEYILYVTNHKTILTDTQKRELIDYCINSKDVEECIFEGPNYRDTTIWRKGDV